MVTDANFVVKKGLNVQDGDISIKGSNKELRFYEGSNYVGFEAPALSANKIWVLPAADGSTGQVLKTDGSGNLGWVTAGDATLAGTQTFTGAKTFSSDVNLNDAGLTINEQYGRIHFKKDATTNFANNYAIFFYNTSDQIKGALNFNISGSRLGFNANGDYQLYLQDGVFYPVVDNDVDLGTSSLKFKDSFFGLVDAENFKINGGQGSDGEVLTSTGSGVAWEAAGGASAIGGLDDVMMDATNFVDGLLIQTDSDGSAPTTGTLNSATGNIGLGHTVFEDLTEGDYNIAIGYKAGRSITTGSDNIVIGSNQYGTDTAQTGSYNVLLGGRVAEDLAATNYNTMVGYGAGSNASGNFAHYNTMVGYSTGNYVNTSYSTALGANALGRLKGTKNIAIGYNAGPQGTNSDGEKNIIIGVETVNASAIVGDGNVMIGKGEFASSTGDNQLQISSGTGTVDWIKGNSSGVVDFPNGLTSGGSAVGGGIASLAADTTPQLGGDLDVNGNELVSTSNANIAITPNGTGKVIIGSTTSQHDTLSKFTIKGSDAGMLIEKHDDGSSGGPTLALYRYSASVADSDLIGQVNFRGEGSTGNPSTYMSLRTEIEDTTEGSKDGKLIVRGLKANSQTDFMSVGSTGVEFEGGAKVGVVTDVTIGSGTSGTTTGFRLGANQEAGMVAGEVSSQSTANDGYIELMNMDLDSLTGSSGLQTIELTVQIEDETNEEVESFKALVQASEKTVLGTTARAVNFTEWAILFDGAARIGTLAADYDSSDDTIRIRYQNKQGSTATLTATFYAITMQNNT